MAPIYRYDDEVTVVDNDDSISANMIAYIAVMCTLLGMSFVVMCLKITALGQKTRDPQQRGMYAGGRGRPSSLGQPPPTIYVSPANLPPPPKYDAMMAPPSYDEVVGIHYPNLQHNPTIAFQPISRPITDAIAAQSTIQEPPPSYHSQAGTSRNDTTVITVTTTAEDRRTAMTVASS